MSGKYQVIISGRTLNGAPLSGIKAEVAQAFRLRDDQVERMLSGKPQVVSRSTSAEGAERLLARLRGLGLEARAELLAESRNEAPAELTPKAESPSSPASDELFALAGPAPAGHGAAAGGIAADALPVDEVVCPKCGEAQPKRTLCRACGLDMPRYLASQEALQREEREARAAELAARRAGSGTAPRTGGGGGGAALLSFSFAGRFGRLDYFSASLLSSVIAFALIWLAVVTGVNGLAGLGMLLSFIYALRCVALRLHDTGRTGWLALVAIVPLIGALMMLALLFIGGEEEDNEYGPAIAEAGAGRALLSLAAMVVVSAVTYGAVTESPERMMSFAQAMGVGPGAPGFAGDADEEAYMDESVQYARNNRIDIYVIAGCTDCDAMQAWLEDNGLYATVYHVDSDRQAAERLQSIIGGNARIQLPVLEVNGKVLPGNPDVGDVHDHLRLASD
ncbi:DUF805 domain-containing protein [Pseudothauera rhizosphaerae]|uniref:DUF805 domain-containing protein n=1 Tax=Pseudothauera rhizosphaerae TaxID=2565932 RepID=A0A4S4ANH8_9RHOO|nr:DUF805 domain-containing protein [Pseudothauera rhizosphaerae]THF61207.1 DUF805 domain-containing protein [Pseudothauera rhizosphaerae]